MDFETARRDTLPKGKVYPITPSILKDRLAKVPQKSAIKVFYSTFQMSERRLQRVKGAGKSDGSKCIIKAQYHSREIPVVERKGKTKEVDQVSEPEVLNPLEKLFFDWACKWRIEVDAIPGELLFKVRESLESEGYKRLEKWFIEKNRHVGSFERHSFSIFLDGDVVIYRQVDDE